MPALNIVIAPDATPPERHGAAELERYLRKISRAASISICVEGQESPGAVRLLVGRTNLSDTLLPRLGLNIADLDEDGFVLASARDEDRPAVVMRGLRDRGTLYSIYAFLEKQGCRFFEPYPLGEVVPSRDELLIHGLLERQNPALPFRELDLDLINDWNIVEATALLDWAVKNRLNTICLVLARNEFIRFLPALKKKIAQRDLSLAIGGHSIFAYLMLPERVHASPIPAFSTNELAEQYARLLEEHPDWSVGHRDAFMKDPCMANPEVVSRLADNLNLFLDHNPEVELFRFQVADGFDTSGHCQCPKCLPGGRLDYRRYGEIKTHFETLYFDAVKAVTERVAAGHPNVAFAHTHVNTFGAPVVYNGPRRPDDMPPAVTHFYVCLESQTYTCPLSSTDYPPHVVTRQSHRDVLESALTRLDATGRRLVVKEMHGSGAYRGLLRNTPRVIAENTRWLHARGDAYAGAMVITNLRGQHHATAWHNFGLNLYTYYRLAWNMHENVDALLADFHQKYFREARDATARLYDLIERKAAHLIFKPFTDLIAWAPRLEGVDFSAIDELCLDESLRERYLKLFDEVKSAKDLLSEARRLARGRVVVDRLALETLACDYLINALHYSVTLYQAGGLYKQALRASSVAERTDLLSRCRRALDETARALDALNAGGMEGKRGLKACNTRFAQAQHLLDTAVAEERPQTPGNPSP